ncbi:MAG TPA: murein biosynthesis integral membrane protein MurJ [Acidimicrobiia bacterium]|nr:murein biosynthesis integral membrane protein MurJ [Acidimicrobiia bacterium]
MNRPLRMGSAAAVVAGSVLLSRLLGLARETLLASLIGVNVDGDLYRQAFTIPDFLNYLLAGAYLTITLIPILSRHLERGDEEGANRAFTSVFRFVIIAIIGLTVVMWVAADPLVSLMFPEASDHARLVSLTRLVLPAQVFLVAGALLMAVQYTHRRFVVPALAPIVYNLGIIAGGLVSALLGEATPEGFLWGAVIGSAIGNFALQWFGSRSTGTRLVPVPRGQSSVGEYLVLALPLMVGQSIAVLDEQFVRWFGQVEEGATSALSFARQLNMVPVGVIAQAAGVAAYPFLARLAARGDNEGLAATTSKAARDTVFVAAGSAAGLLVLARPMVRLLYQWGAFTAADAELVTRLLMIYALSIPAWGLHQILSRHFYAKRRMWTPVLIGTAGTVIAIPVWSVLYSVSGVEGFAIASVIVMSAYAVALLVAWGTDSGWQSVREVTVSLVRAMLAAGVAVLLALPVVNAVFGQGQLTFLGGLGAAVIGGLTALAGFLVVSYLLRAPELKEITGRG